MDNKNPRFTYIEVIADNTNPKSTYIEVIVANENPSSTCISAQSDLGFCHLLTKSVNTVLRTVMLAVPILQLPAPDVQSNLNNLNIFGTMEICLRYG